MPSGKNQLAKRPNGNINPQCNDNRSVTRRGVAHGSFAGVFTLYARFMLERLQWNVLVFLLAAPAAGWAQAGNSSALTEETTQDAAAPPAQPAVFYTAEEMPAFPGGEEALRAFIRSKLQYPQEALYRRISGKVYVRFLVTEEGRIRDATIVKGAGAGLDQEALRLVRIMPWWSPGKNAGQPVPVLYTLPIVFRGVY